MVRHNSTIYRSVKDVRKFCLFLGQAFLRPNSQKEFVETCTSTIIIYKHGCFQNLKTIKLHTVLTFDTAIQRDETVESVAVWTACPKSAKQFYSPVLTFSPVHCMIPTWNRAALVPADKTAWSRYYYSQIYQKLAFVSRLPPLVPWNKIVTFIEPP